MSARWKRLLALLVVGVLLAVVIPAPAPLWAADTGTLVFPAETLTGVVGVKVVWPQATGKYRFAIKLGFSDDYTSWQEIRAVKREDLPDGSVIHFDTTKFKDGVYTFAIQASQGIGQPYLTMVEDRATIDNRPGVPLTQPGVSRGQLQVVRDATGTVGVHVTVDDRAVEWQLRKQPMESTNTKLWSTMYSSGLKDHTYHWYTRDDDNGQYVLRLEVFDTNKHSWYIETTVNVDNRFEIPQTEPGTASAPLTLPKIVSNVLPIPLTFSGTVSKWRLSYINPTADSPRFTSIAQGQMGAEESVAWNTTDAKDGTYLVLLEVEDENRHIRQATATTTIANKVTSTLSQTIGENEEHQYIVTVAGGLTSFRLSSTPLGYYRLTVEELPSVAGLRGRTLVSQRVQRLDKPVQLDLPGGKYLVKVRSQFVLPGSKYTVEMTGATAYTIPLAKLTTNLPLAMRQMASVPVLKADKSERPAEGNWSVDTQAPVTLQNPDGSIDIDTNRLTDGRHLLTFRATNPVGFTTVTEFPFVVDNRPSFSDVPDTDIARWAVELLKDKGVTNGYADGTFKPGNTITRAEFAKMISVSLGLDVNRPYSGAFKDVTGSDWFAPFAEAVYPAGLMQGTIEADGSRVFKPNDPLTRAELMVILLRSADIPEILNDIKTQTLPNPDWRSVQDWARASIYVGMKTGLLQERYGQKIEPTAPAERGEVALALARLIMKEQLVKQTAQQ